MRYLIIVFFVLTGCAKSVSSLKTDQSTTLNKNSGYLLIGVNTNRDLKGIYISGNQNIVLSHKDLRSGSNFILVELPAGTYVIEKVQLNNAWRVEMENEDYWDIEVLPEKINYVGHIDLSAQGFWQVSAHVELVNKSSYAIEFMEQQFPKILATRDIHYGGPGNDTFFEFISNKQEAL